MEVVSASSLPVGSLLWRPRPDAWTLTVVCKATFDLLPLQARLAAQQEPINQEDRWWSGDPAKSLYAASDLVPFKPGADVVLVGSAYVPGGRTARSLSVRLIVDDIDKGLEVAADSAFLQDGTLREGKGFSRMPLVYERAAGGPDTWNPVGVRSDQRDMYGRVRVPNLRPLGLHVTSAGDVIPPVGFGPIPPQWPSRRERLGRHAHGWSPRTMVERPLPEDFNRAFFSVAPRDQWLPLLHEEQRLILENLHPEVPRFVTNLPGLRPRARVEGPLGARPIELKCDTLWIDTDRRLCTLTWSGQVRLDRPDAPGRVVIDVDDPAHQQMLAPPVGALDPLRGQTLPLITEEDLRAASAPVLPFVQPVLAPAPAPPPPPPPPPPAPAPPSSPWAFGGPEMIAAAVEAPPPTARAGEASPLPASAAPAPREVMHLIWYDPESVARVCCVPVFRETLDDLTRERLEGFEELDDGSPAKDPAELEDRHDIFAILARAASMDVAELGEELSAAVRPDHKFVPPLLLLAGELSLPFDEREVLNATVGVVTPIMGNDEGLKAAVNEGMDLLEASHLICPPEVVEGMTARIKDAFKKAPRKITPGTMEAQIERALLARRAYQKRQVLGITAIRALLHPARGGGTPAPVYLPEEIGAKLPGFPRFGARLIAELHLRTDQYEAHPGALKALSLCRVSTTATKERSARRPRAAELLE